MIAKLLFFIALISFGSCLTCIKVYRFEPGKCVTVGFTTSPDRKEQNIPLGICFRELDGTYSRYDVYGNQYSRRTFGYDKQCRGGGGGGNTINSFICSIWDSLTDTVDPFDCPEPQPYVPTPLPSGMNLCVIRDNYRDNMCGSPVTSTVEIACGACNPQTQQVIKCDIQKEQGDLIQYDTADTTCQGTPVDKKTFEFGDCVLDFKTKFRPFAPCTAAGTPWPTTPAPTLLNPCLKILTYPGGTDTKCTTPSGQIVLPCGKCVYNDALAGNLRAHCNDKKNVVNIKYYYDAACTVLNNDQRLVQNECATFLKLSEFLECPSMPPPPPVTTGVDPSALCAFITTSPDPLCQVPAQPAVYPCNQVTKGTKYGDIKMNCFTTPDTMIKIDIMSGDKVTSSLPKQYVQQCVAGGDKLLGFFECPK